MEPAVSFGRLLNGRREREREPGTDREPGVFSARVPRGWEGIQRREGELRVEEVVVSAKTPRSRSSKGDMT